MNDTKRILVVDDEESDRSLLEAMLESLGYSVELARNGSEALEKLNSDIDLVLLDVLMPGLDGLEVARRIRSRADCGDIPIVMVTAFSGKQERLQAAAAGASDFISKPIDRTELHVRLASLLKMKDAREALRHSEEKYRTLVETTKDVIWTVDLDLRYTYVSPSVTDALGYTVDEIMSMNPLDGLTPESREKVLRAFREELALEAEGLRGRYASRTEEIERRHKDGSTRWAEITATFLRDESGKPVGIMGTSRDITRRKEMEHALREARDELEQRVKARTEELLRTNEQLTQEITERKRAKESVREVGEFLQTLLNAIPAPIFYKDTDGRYIGFNRSFEEFFGKAQQDLVGKSVFDIAPRELAEVYHAKDLELFRNPGIQVYESQVEDARGAVHDVVFHKSTFSDPQGEVRGLIGVIIDITQRKRVEDERKSLREQLFQAQKMEAVGTLTGGIAHDFNNLLTIINGYTELILSETTADASNYSDLQKILQTGRKGAELVHRLLVLSKRGETSRQPLDLNMVIENSVGLIGSTFPKMIEIETIVAKNVGMVNADAAQIEQVLMNLFINAKEAMAEGGNIRIVTRNVTVDEVYCRNHLEAKAGPYVLIEVTDTGRGMDSDTVGRIFDPFFTTKGWDYKKGTGLGLSVAKSIVEQHGGWMTCDSKPASGATFKIYLPALSSPAVRKPETQAESSHQGEKILVIDDEDLVRDLGKRILERAGYQVIAASNGKEALEIYAKEHASISLVILDLIMPQMSGEKCLEGLLKIDPHARVIVSSGYSVPQSQRDRLSALAKGFVNKPYQLEHLLNSVRDALEPCI